MGFDGNSGTGAFSNMKRNATIRQALDFDDVLIVPAESAIKPADVDLSTQLTRDITLRLPLVAAPCPRVTESAMAIAMGELGGLGVIHRHMPMGKQVEEVRRIKRHRAHLVAAPITVTPDASLAEALDLMATYRVSGLPVIEQPSRKVIGIITRRDLAFVEDAGQPVSTLMTTKLVSAPEGISRDDARRLMHQNRIEKLVLTDAEQRVAGLLTMRDIMAANQPCSASLDKQGRLIAAAAVGTGKDAIDRALAMADAGLDVVFVDVAHAHSREVAGTISHIRQQRSTAVQVVAGNVVTADAARSLIDAGADAIKVGIGQSAMAAARAAGIGLPQLQAVLDVVDECGLQDIPVLVDGGFADAAAGAKALAAGARALVLGGPLAGAEEAPGVTGYRNGGLYRMPAAPIKTGFVDALDDGMQDETGAAYIGPVAPLMQGYADAVARAMAYAGARDLMHFRDNAEFVQMPRA